jgi:hypothetical protein
MGFDVDVLLLLHQKVTGFEADCDDALELREMIQRAVRKKTEEAYAYAVSTGKKKQSRPGVSRRAPRHLPGHRRGRRACRGRATTVRIRRVTRQGGFQAPVETRTRG